MKIFVPIIMNYKRKSSYLPIAAFSLKVFVNEILGFGKESF